MDESAAKALLDNIIGQIFGYKNPLTLEQFRQKFAFDGHIPKKGHKQLQLLHFILHAVKSTFVMQRVHLSCIGVFARLFKG